jgi:hypothetical protein
MHGRPEHGRLCLSRATEKDAMGQCFLAHLRSLAEVIGDAELNAVLEATRRITHRAIRRDDIDSDEHLTVSENIGDWLGNHADDADPIDVLWPRCAALCPIEVFAPYAELWQAGSSCVFRTEMMVIGPLASASGR